MISANGVEYKNLPEQVQYLTERAAEFAVELNRVSASIESVAGDVAALQTSYTTLAEDVRVAKININSLFVNVGTALSEIANIKNGTTHLFETITDSHGNPRFVEGDITMETIEGVTQTYGKWSLSGTHLMIVIAGNIAANTEIIQAKIFAYISLPTYIKNKILTMYGAVVSFKNEILYTSTGGGDNISARLIKAPSGSIYIDQYGTKTYTYAGLFRIQFDLLIDDE